MLHTDERNLQKSNAIDSLHQNIHFKGWTNITSKFIKWTRDYIEIYMERRQKQQYG